MGHPEAEVALSVVGDRKMRALNRQYRQIDRTTDVLSFSLREGEFPAINAHLWGDVIISWPRAKAQAGEARHSLEEEMAYLFLHGILHLAGLDHEGEPSRKARFKRWQRKLWPKVAEEVHRWEKKKNSVRALSVF